MSKTTQSTQQYWDERSDLFGDYYKQPSWFDKIFRKAIYTRVAVAVKTVKELNEPTVLDIGSGPGINSVTILKNTSAKKVTGIDFAPNMVEYANAVAQKEGVLDKCEFIEGNFMEHDWNGKIFNVSIALGVLDYIKNSENFLKNMDKITSNAFIISWPENGLRMWLRRQRYACSLFHYDEERIKNLHGNCKIVDLELIRMNGGWVSVARK